MTDAAAAMVIALVEDSAADEALTLRAFQRSGLCNPVVVLRTGVEAVHYLLGPGGEGAEPRPPHLVLLDLKLPGLDGIEVLRRLRAHEPTKLLPVVVLTSSDDQKAMVESYQLGVNSYISKPVDFAEFTDVIKQIGLYWVVLNRAPAAGAR